MGGRELSYKDMSKLPVGASGALTDLIPVLKGQAIQSLTLTKLATLMAANLGNAAATSLTATTLSATTGNIVTVNSTTVETTTLSAVTANVPTVNASTLVETATLSADTVNVTDIALGNDMTIAEAGNLILGTTTGSQLGTTSQQKLSVFGKAPIVKGAALTAINASGITATYNAVEQSIMSNMRVRLNEVESKIQAFGIFN